MAEKWVREYTATRLTGFLHTGDLSFCWVSILPSYLLCHMLAVSAIQWSAVSWLLMWQFFYQQQYPIFCYAKKKDYYREWIHSWSHISTHFGNNNGFQWTLFIGRSSYFVPPTGTKLLLISWNSNMRQGFNSSNPTWLIRLGYADLTEKEKENILGLSILKKDAWIFSKRNDLF